MDRDLVYEDPSIRQYIPVKGQDVAEELFQAEEINLSRHPEVRRQIKLDQLAFFINGLINNFTYVVFLSAAEDIVGNSVPKATVLIADIIPSVCVKLVMPYYMHNFSYSARIFLIVFSAILSLFVVAFGNSLPVQLLGIVVASAGSGLGEITFLALASFYPHDVISPWSSGTGAAGVAGSLAYLALSTWFGLKPSSSLLLCAAAPLFMFISYFKLMSHPQLAIESDRLSAVPLSLEEPVAELRPENLPLVERFKIVRSMVSVYMLPLLLVFWAEYTINQGVAPVLLFPLERTPFKALRDHYVYYQFLYQLGVFVSRSSSGLFPINKLWYLVLAQFGTLGMFLFQALLVFDSNIYVTLLFIFWEGLFGGAIYANAFRRLNSEMPRHQTEFAMGAASVADSFGIAMASITAYVLEPILCNYQITQGIQLCNKAVDL
ncbi:battenin CLN3 protein [Entomophthora muscae]|uniref:Battenin CLN3 protein n=2 Tax=Entomophthora muscae TaxID=34485 RepID=A0ACC2SCQ6_9FUNG|nr:battenin CLN3 protein [Entomophthora muscae]